jgi:uncharacterized protein (DUF488 family)
MRVWSVGTSNNNWTSFKRLLVGADIEVLIDVRSRPVSRHPHFNRPTLRAGLNAAGIGYVFLGLELGGRPAGGGYADYEAMAVSPLFIEGLQKVEELAQRARPVLCCAEAEPLACHRCLLVGRRLVERGVEVEHILRDGSIEPHAMSEDRLLKLTRQTEADLFASREGRLARAYRAQNQRLWRPTPAPRRRPT